MSRRVVIVDDSLTVRMDLVELFEEAGFVVAACATAAQAREALASPADAIVLDVLLPDGNGIDLLAEIRAGAGTHVPTIVLSTEDEVKDRIRGLKTGADDYIGKPYDRAYLLGRVLRLVAATGDGTSAAEVRPILVIDDSATFRQELREHLENAGYRVVVAADGAEGLRQAALHKPAAAIIDGILPDLDGASIVQRLRLDPGLRDTPSLLLTAEDSAVGEIAALDAGADGYARKSEDISVVLARLAAMLRTASDSRLERRTSVAELRKVLVVDADTSFVHELDRQLHDEGYDVVKARSGDEALELLALQPVDAILLDFDVPGLPGAELCRRLKESPALRYVPVILLTAADDREAMRSCTNLAADDFLAKSQDLEPLKARLRAQLRRKQFEESNRRRRDELLAKESEARQARAVAVATQELSQRLAQQNASLESLNRELQTFAYSVSHDLRAPLRAVLGYGKLLADTAGAKLDETERRYLDGMRAGATRMGELIDGLLTLSRVTRKELTLGRLRLDVLAARIAKALRELEPQRDVEFVAAESLEVDADQHLIASVLENLLGNAWKFTSRCRCARIELGMTTTPHGDAFFVKDNGAGFDMQYASGLFTPFQRMHSEEEFPGNGIGLATVQRIIHRHGGRIWAEATLGAGACFYFTLWEEGLPQRSASSDAAPSRASSAA